MRDETCSSESQTPILEFILTLPLQAMASLGLKYFT